MADAVNPIYKLKLLVLSRIKDVKVLNFFDDIYHVLCLPFGYLSYLVHRLLGRPYFGVWLASAQGNPARFPYMTKCVGYLSAGQDASGNDDFRILEIGAYAGGSAIVWAKALKQFNIASGKVISVDPWDSYLNPNANRHMHFRIMNRNLGNGNVLKLFVRNLKAAGIADICFQMRGRSEDILPMLSTKKFDVIYIDANHHVDAITKDLQVALPLLKDSGLMCGPALEMQMDELDRDFVIANFETDLTFDPRTQRIFHPGISYAIGEFFGRPISKYGGFWVVQKKGTLFEDVVLD